MSEVEGSMIMDVNPDRAHIALTETLPTCAEAAVLSELYVGLLIVIVIVVLLLGQEDAEVGMAL
jgi:hypothetical protein